MKIIAVDEYISEKLKEGAILFDELNPSVGEGHAMLKEDAEFVPVVGQVKEWFNNTKLLITNVMKFDGEDGDEEFVVEGSVQS